MLTVQAFCLQAVSFFLQDSCRTPAGKSPLPPACLQDSCRTPAGKSQLPPACLQANLALHKSAEKPYILKYLYETSTIRVLDSCIIRNIHKWAVFMAEWLRRFQKFLSRFDPPPVQHYFGTQIRHNGRVVKPLPLGGVRFLHPPHSRTKLIHFIFFLLNFFSN